MNKEQIISRIAEIDAEIAKRKKDTAALDNYNTGRKRHKKQLAFHKCKKRIRWVFGGNRSGKTECGAVEAIWLLRGIHPYRKNRPDVFGWAVSLSQQVQRDVAQSKILKYLPKSWIEDITMLSGRKDAPASGIIDQIKIKNVFGGISTLGFKSCDQGREKFQGSSLDFVWIDEEPPKDIYDECLMRVMDRRGDIFGTMTPLKGETFIYNEIYLNRRGNPQVWCEFMSWEDNPYLSKSEIKLLSQSLDEATLDARKYGKFSKGAGLVYPEFDSSVHVIAPFAVPKEWQENISIDPAVPDLDAHARSLKDISARIGWKTDSKGRISALIDSAANQRTLACAKSVAELFGEKGILVNTKVNKDVFSGICRVKEYLKRGNGRPNI